ncbi:Very long-chain acyl-CoA synthetase [Bagarius yarrelli]|uniref:Long-chain-fatty-acid--CoA ligase n=1 Tax=Bagarius yarrelli TaxID=175774 RepID=A0A556VUB0_BAGYA|nr:Very long-chain acyl-CoA synthetase [Bagarius yarrelli]
MSVLYALFVLLVSVLLLVRVFCPYVVYDVLFVLKGVRVAMRMRTFRSSSPCYSILDCFLDAVKKHPEKKFVVFEGRSYTYSEADQLSSKAARVLLQHTELQEGDTVALFLGNEPNFVWIWLALCKLGCTAALLNSNIRAKSLLHCFTCCGAKTLITGADLQEAVEEVLPVLKQQEVRVFQLGENRLPKAAVINHERVWLASFLQRMSGVRTDDVIYVYLPLYHSAGFLMGLTGAIERGITVVLKRKFSASQFWNDCRKYNVTVIQYIGEIMRYLCNTPKTDSDRVHNVRLALGNGLRADTWAEFLQRFGDVRICECYGATEGNVGLVNYMGKIGAVGRANSVLKVTQGLK